MRHGLFRLHRLLRAVVRAVRVRVLRVLPGEGKEKKEFGKENALRVVLCVVLCVVV
jgi:hypothetical protein